jgi:Sec-independent protein translocase protein TatA
MRRWVIRIVVVAAVVFVTWMWGPAVVRRLRRQAQQTAGEFQKAGKQMKEGTERRAGKGVDVDNP